jgi:Flp pilus assembly protein CpaB
MAIQRTDAAAVIGGLAVGVLMWIGWIRLPAPPPHEKVFVFVAKEKILQGTKITDPEALFEVREFNKGEEPHGAVDPFENVRDKRVNKTLLPGAAITPDDFMAPGNLADRVVLPVGYRAVSFKVANHEAILARLQTPSWVGVLVARPTEDGGTSYETVAPELRLLAVDGVDKVEDGKAIWARTVTVAVVTAEQATRLARAQQEGELWLCPVLVGDQ